MTAKEQCKKLYKDAFGESQEFDNMLFQLFFDNVETLEKDGKVAAMYFKIPCILNLNNVKSKAYYIYAVTTHSDYRHQGLMSKLFVETQTEPDTHYFLKPSSEDVIAFYNQAGFKQIVGTRETCDATIEVKDDFKSLSKLCDKPQKEYPIMIKGITDIEKLTFEYTLE
ncbi:MAG: GNAT family N-acetyltransferase [Clostridia bacterium]|nr:GNAT family N-acetyltransferase [Clostridia bacterium]